MTGALVFAAACAPAPLSAQAVDEGGVVTVSASAPGISVVLADPGGVPIVRGVAPEATRSVSLALPPGTAGRVVATVRAGAESVEVGLDLGDPSHLDAALTLPLGAPPVRQLGAAPVRVSVLEGTSAAGALRVRAPRDEAVQVWLGAEPLGTVAAGGAAQFGLAVHDDVVLRLTTPSGAAVETLLDVQAVPLEAARAALTVADARFPALADGTDDPVRPPGRLTLPAPWWRAVLDHSPLGVRARDPWAPWAWTAVDLANGGATPLDVVVRARIVDDAGAPHPAFRPRMREADDGTGNTSVLLRVPAGGHATASLPVFVDEAALGPDVPALHRVIEVLPLGADRPLTEVRAPLYLSRSSSVVAIGLVLTLATAAAGAVWTARGVGRWLRELDTAALVTVALFGALHFVTGTVGMLLGLGAAAAAGPFATLVTGIVDDALQATLVGTLVFLLPRPGVATLSVLVAWLLRGVATGSLSPLDVVFVSCRVATLEGSLWAAGLTRGGAWRDAPRRWRVLRLGLGLAAASSLGTAASLVLHSALFRLYYAPWYVAMVLAGPGFAYALAASGLAERIATQLRRVED